MNFIKRFSFLFFAMFTLPLLSGTKLPPPYNSIKLLPQRDVDGMYRGMDFYPHEEEMEKLVQQHNVRIAVELGSWLGRSACHIAKILPEDGRLYAVDRWRFIGQDVIRHADLKETFYEQFLSNVIHAKLAHKIVPLRMETAEGSLWLKKNNIRADLIYVDADHTADGVYHDLANYYELLSENGVICGDDWNLQVRGKYPIRIGVTLFAKRMNLRIFVKNERLWILREKI